MNLKLWQITSIFAVLCLPVSQLLASNENIDNSKAAADEVGVDAIESILVLGYKNPWPSEITEEAEKLVSMPGSLGDPLGSITALPGVMTPAGGGEPVIRGSSPEDNRYYIDGLPAGYIFHEFNTSIFDRNVVQDFLLYPAGFGVRYSQGIGSVFDIRLRDPKNTDLITRIDISMLRSSIFFESGVTDNSAAYLSLRRGMLDLFISEEDEPEDGVRVITPPKDADYQFKGIWAPNGSNHTLTLSVGGASDFVEAEFGRGNTIVEKNPDYEGDARVDLGFDSQSLNWRIDGNSFATVLAIGAYEDKEYTIWGEGYFVKLDRATDLARGEVEISVNKNHLLKLGSEFAANSYDYASRMVLTVCTDFEPGCQDGRRDLVELEDAIEILESSVYISDQWVPTEKLLFEIGVQYAGNDYTDEYFVNPRLAANLKFNDRVTFTSSGGRYNQTPEAENLIPGIGNRELDAPSAIHFTLGTIVELKNLWSWSIEGYRKELMDLPVSLDEDEPDGDQYYAAEGEGKVSGAELLLKKGLERSWYGWASLSYSQSDRTNTRTGKNQSYAYDTPVVFNLVASYLIGEKWEAGFRYTLKSGEATTEILGVKENPDYPGRFLPVYGEPFADRLPNYSRLDLRFSRQLTFWSRDGSFYIDIRNVLNKENVAARELDYTVMSETGELRIKDSTEMGIFGSIGVSVTF